MRKLINNVTTVITSMKFALVILALLAIFMIVGSFMSSGLFTSSYLFAILSFILLLSLLLCCIRRTIKATKTSRQSDIRSIRTWIGSFGSPVMHIGVMFVIAGMIMGQFTGFNDDVTFKAGESYTDESIDFEVRLDSFEIVCDEDYNITDYISMVTVIEDGEEILTTEVTVNDPLEYKGVKFYQSTYGWVADVLILETESGDVFLDSDIYLSLISSSGGIGLADYSMSYMTMEFILVPDQEEEGVISSLSPVANNPALFFLLYYGDSLMVSEDTALGETSDISGLTITFEGLEQYSGLSVSYKPELPLIFSGSIVFIVGLFIVFYVRKAVYSTVEVETIEH
jgi:cytochrome c biogenesis protein